MDQTIDEILPELEQPVISGAAAKHDVVTGSADEELSIPQISGSAARRSTKTASPSLVSVLPDISGSTSTALRTSLYDGLIACYPFHDATDAISLKTGVAVDVSFVAGKVGNAAEFNGSTSFLANEIQGFAGLDRFTISFWVYHDAYVPSEGVYGQILDLTNEDGEGVVIRNTGSYLEFKVADGDVPPGYQTSVEYYYSLSYFPLSTWIHIVACYGPTSGRYAWTIYVNGVIALPAIDGSSRAAIKTSSATGISFGGVFSTLTYSFDGKLDEFNIWNRELTSEEITQVYASAWPFGVLSCGSLTTKSSIEAFFPRFICGSLTTTSGIKGVASNGNVSCFYAKVGLSGHGWQGLQKIYASYHKEWQIDFEDFAQVPAELHGSLLELCTDAAGNCYVGVYSISYRLACFDKAGEIVWFRTMPIPTAAIKSITSDGDYVYAATNYTGGKIYKFNAATGAEVAGGFPVTNSIIVGNSFKKLKIGRDGYLYAGVNHTMDYANGFIYKLDPDDGSLEWSYQLTQGVDGNTLRDIDINISGEVAVASIKSQLGDDTHVLTSAGGLYSEWDVGSEMVAIAIDNDGYVYGCPYGNSSNIVLCKYDPDNTSSPVWAITIGNDKYTVIISADGSELHVLENTFNDRSFSVYNSATGSLLRTVDIFAEKICLVPIVSPAWDISVTVGLSGELQNNLGGAMETGDYLFPVGENIDLSVVPNTEKFASSIIVDGVEQV